jgi:hypothetical protein
MKKILYILILLILCSCSKDYEYDELDFNINSGKGRTNSYEHFGVFPLQLLTEDKIISDDSTGINQTPLRLKSPITILATISGNILKVNNLTVEKTFKIDSGFVVASGMTSDKSSNVYFISSNDILFSLDSELNLKWKKVIPVKLSRALSYSDLLATDDGIYLGTNSGDLIKYDFNGDILWHYKGSLAVSKSFCADNKGNIYLPITNNQFGETDSIIKFNSDGTIKWKIALENSRILSNISSRNNKIFFTGALDKDTERIGIVYCYDDNGKKIWSAETTLPGRHISVDYDGIAYVSTTSSGIGEISTGILSFDEKGKEMWRLYFGASAISPLFICEKYLAFSAFTADGAAIFYMRKDDGLLVKNHSLSNLPPLYLQPLVGDDATIRLYGSEKLKQIKFTQTSLEKFLQ